MDPAPLWRGASDRADFHALLMALEHAPELLERDDVDRLLDLLLRDYMLKKSRSMMLPDVARFDAVDPRDAMRLFRFELPSISCIAQQVLGGAPLHTQEGDVYEPIYGTCLMLRYLAAPVRLQDLELEFGRCTSSLSRILNDVLQLFACRATSYLKGLDTQWILENAEELTDAVKRVTKIDSGIYGFVDGKLFYIGRPEKHVRAFYNGQKKRTAVKYQLVTLPNGVFHSMFGPCAGVDHDSFIFGRSRVPEQCHWLDDHVRNSDANPVRGQGLVLLGDSAYPTIPGAMGLDKDFQVEGDPTREAFRRHICEARTEIEHMFAFLTNLWQTLRVQDKMHLLRRNVPALIEAAVFLTNCATCARGGNQVSDKFAMKPPDLEAYLQYCNERAQRIQ